MVGVKLGECLDVVKVGTVNLSWINQNPDDKYIICTY